MYSFFSTSEIQRQIWGGCLGNIHVQITLKSRKYFGRAACPPIVFDNENMTIKYDKNSRGDIVLLLQSGGQSFV